MIKDYKNYKAKKKSLVKPIVYHAITGVMFTATLASVFILLAIVAA